MTIEEDIGCTRELSLWENWGQDENLHRVYFLRAFSGALFFP